jgi:CRP/FNR family transcriptional regulator
MNSALHPTTSSGLSVSVEQVSSQLDRLPTLRHNMDATFTHEAPRSVGLGLGGNRPLWRASLNMIERHVPVNKRLIRAHNQLYTFGQPFETLHLINSGIFKIVTLASDGRERSADLVFDGDWLGFDGIPTGQHSCTAIALDTGEVWTLRYDDLMQAAAKDPSLLHQVLAAISAQLSRNRDIALSMGTLSAEGRVADFLLMWATSLAQRGRRTDEINVQMSRADIGAFLGIRLESVSRALTKLAQCGVISFVGRGRRDICIPSLSALSRFVQGDTERCDHHLQ